MSRGDEHIGREIFENIPNVVRPFWAKLLIVRFDNYIENVPELVVNLYAIIDDENRWHEAHQQFNRIRQFGLSNKEFQPSAYLLLAENVAKVTYNASGQPAPFDHDSGWCIPGLALEIADAIGNKEIKQEIKLLIKGFRTERIMNNLDAARVVNKYIRTTDD